MADTNKNSSINLMDTAATDANHIDEVIDDQFSDVRQEMNSRFALLPEQLQNVITGSDYQQKLFEIAKTHKMTYDELSIIELETTMVLLGMTRPEEYRDELQIELKKNDDEMEGLVKDVNDKVFSQVRGALERVYAAKKEPEDYIMPAPDAASNAPAFASPSALATPVLPPVAAQPLAFDAAKTSTLSSAEKNTLEKTGVILTETPAAQPVIISPKPMQPLPSRGDLLQSIENPPKTPSSSISMDKLSSPLTSVPPKTTNYTVAKTPTPPTAAPSSGDQYREPIE